MTVVIYTHTHTHQSVGNVDGAVYAHTPDPKLEITDTGKKQAQVNFLLS